jgi:molybdenum cofactor cytidylyltransferase
MIAAIILAAGSSTRMGRPKALLPIGHTTFLRHILDLYRDSGVDRTVVVLGKDSGSVGAEFAGADAMIAVNPRPEGGQISSLLVGLKALEPLSPPAVIVHPVDHPAVTAATIRQVVDSALTRPGKIIIPVCAGRRGHPVVFPSGVFRDLERVPSGEGARAVTRSRSADVLEIDTEDEGVLTDIDTPDDYERLH